MQNQNTLHLKSLDLYYQLYYFYVLSCILSSHNKQILYCIGVPIWIQSRTTDLDDFLNLMGTSLSKDITLMRFFMKM